MTPYRLSGGSSITPQPSPEGPDPRCEKRTSNGEWTPVALRGNRLLSFYYCSAHALEGVRADGDLTDVGC